MLGYLPKPMLTYSQIIEKYSPEIVQRNPRAVLVEYLQYEILDSLFKQKGSEHLSFIGGTAIRIVYGSARFSEDLDFDNFGLSFAEFDELLQKVVSDMQNKGFVLEFRLVEKGAYHCYVKFPELLQLSGLPSKQGEKILIRVDAVRKEKYFEPNRFLLDSFDVRRNILVNSIDIILAQKIITIIQRKREKGRDIYDVDLLLGRAEPNYEYIEKQFGFKKDEVLARLKKRVTELDLKELAKDVLPFLLNADDQNRILLFREYVEQKLI